MKSGSKIWLLLPNRRIEGAFGKTVCEVIFFLHHSKGELNARHSSENIMPVPCCSSQGTREARDSGAMRPIMRRRVSPEVGLEEWFGSSFVPLKFQNLGEGVQR